ncbi:unnamed protein product, partial [Prorocentrum cordatum]
MSWDEGDRGRSRSPRPSPRSTPAPTPSAVFSPGKYKESVFQKFGRSSSAFADRFTAVAKTHAAVKKLVEKNAERLGDKYDELCVVKTQVDEMERGGARVHDLFLLRVFMAVFGGPRSPWRAHDGQAHRYHNGAFRYTAAMNVQQALRLEHAVNRADAILLRMSKDKNVKRPSWDEGWLLDYTSPAAATQADVDDDPDESFSIARKMLRESLNRFLTTGNNVNILKTFCKWCDQPKQAEPTLAFKDKCLKIQPGQAAREIKKAPEVNCYAYMDLSIKYKPPAADVDRYDLMMATLYGDDVESKEIEVLGEALALMHKRQPPR